MQSVCLMIVLKKKFENVGAPCSSGPEARAPMAPLFICHCIQVGSAKVYDTSSSTVSLFGVSASLHLRFGLPMFRCPPTFILHVLIERPGRVVVSTSAWHAAGLGFDSRTKHVSVLCVKTWLSTLEIVYLGVLRRPSIPSIWRLCQGK